MKTQPTTINPAATRYATASKAYQEALEAHLGAVAGGHRTDHPQTLTVLWQEYDSARRALRPTSRVKGAA